MIGRKSTTFLHKSLLVGWLQVQASRAALTELCWVCQGPECDFAECNVICAKGLGDSGDREREGGNFAPSGVYSAGQCYGCFIKARPWELEQRKKWDSGKNEKEDFNEGHLSRHLSAVALFRCWSVSRDGMEDCLSLLSLILPTFKTTLLLAKDFPPYITRQMPSEIKKNLHETVRFSSKQVPRAVPTLNSE